jgi:CheY-like chemotaxis protein
MNQFNILWVDDEIDLLKPHIIFLNQKGYSVKSCQSGMEALESIEEEKYDIVFLDENMPGLSGLETLNAIKEKQSNLPVVMITKSEEEYIMEEAIGNKIADYLIKPVNPNQILLSLKKNLDHNRLVSEKTTSNYQQEFRKIAMDLAMINSYEEWIDLYHKLLYWELALNEIEDTGMRDILESQKTEANLQFGKFIEQNYQNWFQSASERPLLSIDLINKKILPHIRDHKRVLMIVVDNLRFDQWKTIEKYLNPFYEKTEELSYFSILPTATQYSRNAIFSGLMPLEMEKSHPNLWKNDIDEGGKNLHEKEFLESQLQRLGMGDLKFSYHKITNIKSGKKLAENLKSLNQNSLNVVVYNFVDMLSHSKTEMEVIKELASDDKAYRSLTESWFRNSPLMEIIRQAQLLGLKLVITTDHGTINVKAPSKVIGDRDTSLNLRYKTGRSLSYQEKDVFAVKNPDAIQLPSLSMNSSFIFAKGDLFLAYPNNFNHYVKYYRNTYQHGGVSLEEMIIPYAEFDPR